VRSKNICFGHVLVAVFQGQRRDAVATGEERHGRCTAGQSKYIRLYRYSAKLALVATNLPRARVVSRSFAAGAPPLTEGLYRWRLRRKKTRRGPTAALPGAGVWRSAWGDCARRPSTARHATFNDQVFAGSLSKVINLDSLLWGKLVPVASHQSPRRSQKICFSPAAVFTEPPVVREFCSKL